MSVKQTTWTGTTDGSGDSIDDSPYPVTGEILMVLVDGTNLTNGADLDLNPIYTDVDANEILGEDIIDNEDVGNAALNEFYPSRPIEDKAGTSELYAGAGEVVPTLFSVAGAKLRCTVAAGGNAVKYRITVVYRD